MSGIYNITSFRNVCQQQDIGGEALKPTTEYGKAVKRRLIEMEQTQRWLEQEVSQKTGLYCDSSLLYKIFTGKAPGKKIVNAINEILQLNATS